MAVNAIPLRREKSPAKRPRLTREDWVRAGLDGLADGGIEAVRIESLAENLGVTKGSFYAHFDSRDDLLEAIAAYWGGTELDALAREVMLHNGTPRQCLTHFSTIYIRENLGVYDSAMRAWALNDERAARAVRDANAIVEATLATVYRDLGFNPQDAVFRAQTQILYGIGLLFGIEYHGDENVAQRRLEDYERFLDLLVNPNAETRN